MLVTKQTFILPRENITLLIPISLIPYRISFVFVFWSSKRIIPPPPIYFLSYHKRSRSICQYTFWHRFLLECWSTYCCRTDILIVSMYVCLHVWDRDLFFLLLSSLSSLSFWQPEQKDLFFDRLPLSRGHKICISFHLSGLVDYPAVCLVTEILYILHLWVLKTSTTTTGVFLRVGMCWRGRGFITWMIGI